MKATKENNSLYNEKLRKNSHSLRYTMTKAESCLWKYALRAKMTGYTFNRQRPVLNYVADFMCKELKVIIEVDGYSHSFDKILKKDAQKQRDLENVGFRVLRFSDNEVLRGIQNVIRAIEITIEEIQDSVAPPPTPTGASGPAPSSGGQTPSFR